MKTLPFTNRILMTLLMTVGMFMTEMDAFGQAVSDFNNTNCSSGANAVGDCSAAIGSSTVANGDNSVAIGNGSTTGSLATSSVAIGATAQSDGEQSFTFGDRVKALDDFGMAIGRDVISDANYAYIFGRSALGLGGFATNDIDNSIMFVMNSNVSSMFIGNAGGTSGSYGNVGIGNITDDAASLLHVRDQVRVGYDSEDNGSIIFNNSTNSNTVTFQSGVTTSTHSYTLPLAQGSADEVLTNDGSGNLSWEDPDANAWKLTGNAGTTAGTNFLGTTDAQDVVFKVNWSEVVRITQSDEYVGIGTDGAYTPSSKLHVVSDDTDIARFGDPTAGNSNSLRITNTSAAASGEFSGGIQSRGSVSDKPALQLMALIDEDQDTLESPVMNFRVRDVDNNPIDTRPLFAWDNAGSNTTVMLVDAVGNVGIGTTSPQGKLEVNGTVFVDFSSLPNGSQSTDYFLGVDASGQLLNLGMSTIQVKEQVEDIEFDREAFLSLRPVDFKWKDFYGGYMDVGLIAQEVEQTFPALASYQYKRTYLSNGDFERDSLGNAIEDTTQMEVGGVRYHKLPVYLLALAKDQQTEIEDLRDQVESLMTIVENCCASEPAYRIDDLNGVEEGTKEIDEYVLLRNDPNPFADYTEIKYETSSCENCQIIITDMSGRIVKRINLFRSNGSIRVYASEIGNGVFSYSILEEGRVIASAKMISSRQ